MNGISGLVYFHAKKDKILSWLAQGSEDVRKYLKIVRNPDFDVDKKRKCPDKCEVVLSYPSTKKPKEKLPQTTTKWTGRTPADIADFLRTAN